MTRPRRRVRLDLEHLGDRVVCSAGAFGSTPPAVTSSPTPTLHPGTYPSADRFRNFTPADLQAYAKAYLSFIHEPNYNPAYDFNGTGFVGQNDATPILRGLASITPKRPLNLTLKLAPGQQVFTQHPSVSGAATRLGVVTIEGTTTPNSAIFYDSFINNRLGASGNFKFEGGVLIADATGHFIFKVPLTVLSKNSLTTVNLLVRTPFDQQTIRAFPIFRIGPRSR